MIVDAHVHILPDRVRDNLGQIMPAEPWFAACHSRGQRVASAESLVAAMDEQRVDRAVCFSWPFNDPTLCSEANDYVAAACRRFPQRLVGFGVIQPGDPRAALEVTRCARLGLRGIGELNADAQGWSVHSREMAAAVSESVSAGFPWTLHCSEPLGHDYPGKGTITPERVIAFAERHPDLTVICAHLGGGLPLYAHIPEVRTVCERLHFDTAAQPFVFAPSVYRAVIDAVGAERILLGSDHPLLAVPRYLQAFDEARLDDAERALVSGANAARLLNL
ncbi:MAG: amidohydrolase family protein [Candidatus Dormibacteraeota bacterium]|uniref:Amidohydrolase family protein n=1 Tax=Candidatus Amunia macphersoniae TaxID=3127014 RepID=A0A934KF84_9BACT|nr:amidohydrolase family protein [Candidatus Dormibacteraeota bacterium]